jgi:hypothetical protein
MTAASTSESQPGQYPMDAGELESEHFSPYRSDGKLVCARVLLVALKLKLTAYSMASCVS